MDKNKFINSIKNGALYAWTEYKILPSLTISQAILESNWGNSELSQKANNLFGIKASSDWKGKRIMLSTNEWSGNDMQSIDAEFRAYDSFYESITDHSKILIQPRYELVRKCDDYKLACASISQCGYATDPNYSEKLIELIKENELYKYDSGQDIKSEVTSSMNDKVRKFQHLCNVLGIRDSEYKSLIEDNILGFRTKSCISKMPMLMVGVHGAAVEFVQEILNTVVIDGDYGNITRCFVMEYQKEKNLTVDGIVGKESWNVLITT